MQSHETVDSVIRKLTSALTLLHGRREASALARLVVRSVTGRSPAELLRDAQEPFPKELLPKVNNILRDLKERKPVQYLLGETEFYGCRIMVTPAVLIPRPETEELVHRILQLAGDEYEGTRILDIGTGSGCIAVALAKNLPDAEVYACDVSGESLTVAAKNAEKNKVNVHFFEMDILHPDKGRKGMFTCIISNPPYIPESEKDSMQPEVIKYEPATALFVPDEDPLLYYRAILTYARDHLTQEGLLMVEVHEKKARDVARMFREYGMKHVKVIYDLNGKERFVEGRKI